MKDNELLLPCNVSDLLVGDSQNVLVLPCLAGETSDGAHSFNDLYKHRNLLFIGLLNLVKNGCWYSKQHYDGSAFDGWFICGVELEPGQQITYHLPNEYLPLCELSLQYREYAPQWDGHNAEDVLNRLTQWIERGCYVSPINEVK